MAMAPQAARSKPLTPARARAQLTRMRQPQASKTVSEARAELTRLASHRTKRLR